MRAGTEARPAIALFYDGGSFSPSWFPDVERSLAPHGEVTLVIFRASVSAWPVEDCHNPPSLDAQKFRSTKCEAQVSNLRFFRGRIEHRVVR